VKNCKDSRTSARRTSLLPRGGLAALALLILASSPLAATPATYTKPNILAIFGDDIGWFNLSIYNHGMMGYETPNLDRIGEEGIVFTDAYAEQSCTAGRAAFLTGQHGLRTGMIKVGLPGVPFGLSTEDPTIPVILKYGYGYATGQFGKNHLGDTNDILPTMHGFDQFFGNLYHLNAEEEPENPDYWSDPLPAGYGWLADMEPRGVLFSYAADVTEGTPPAGTCDQTDPLNNGTTGQCIVDTGSLTSERMKGIDGAFAREAIRFMEEASTGTGVYSAGAKPFFTWYAASRMHIWTHLKKKAVPIADAGTGDFDSSTYTAFLPDLWDGVNNGGT
jgi:arylsulfatase